MAKTPKEPSAAQIAMNKAKSVTPPEVEVEHAALSGDDVLGDESKIQARIDAAVKVALSKAALINTKDTGSKTSSLTKEDLATILQTILPATIMAMEQAKTLTAHDVTMKALKAKLDLEEKCSCCRQSVGNGKGRGCGGPWKRDAKGNYITEKVLDATTGEDTGETRRIEDFTQFHEKMVVYPADPIAEQQFDGVQINGAYYRSQGPGHRVWVPKNNDIASMLMKFTEDQRVQATGRKKMRNSGSISGNGGQNVNSPTFT